MFDSVDSIFDDDVPSWSNPKEQSKMTGEHSNLIQWEQGVVPQLLLDEATYILSKVLGRHYTTITYRIDMLSGYDFRNLIWEWTKKRSHDFIKPVIPPVPGRMKLLKINNTRILIPYDGYIITQNSVICIENYEYDGYVIITIHTSNEDEEKELCQIMENPPTHNSIVKASTIINGEINDKSSIDRNNLFFDFNIDSLVNRIKKFFDSKNIYQKCGIQFSRGIIFHGPPGTGKTTLCKYIESEVRNATCFWVTNGSLHRSLPAIIDMASKYSPSIVFIEDIDSEGMHRDDWKSQTLGTILNVIDGRQSKDGVLFIATTNRYKDLDPALVRSSRFDETIKIDYPTDICREKQIKHLKKQLELKINVKDITRQTNGQSQSDIQEEIRRILFNTTSMNHDHRETRPKRRVGFNRSQEHP